MLRKSGVSLLVLTLTAFGGLPILAHAQQAAPPPASALPEEDGPPIIEPPVDEPPVDDEAPAANAPASATGDAMQVMTSAQGVRYVSGGVGETDREALKAMAGEFNLELMFAMQGGGEYLADVKVRIVDSKGAVVLDNVVSKGPYFLAKLPSGSYTVEANANGQIQKNTAKIGAEQRVRLNFLWR